MEQTLATWIKWAMTGGFSSIILLLILLLKTVHANGRRSRDVDQAIDWSHKPPCAEGRAERDIAINEVNKTLKHNCEKNGKEHGEMYERLDDVGKGVARLEGRFDERDK